MGMERVVALLEQGAAAPPAFAADVFLVAQGEAAARAMLPLAEALRGALPGRRIESNLGGGNFKAQFRRADRSGAPLALVLGEDELTRGVAQLKPLREGAGAPQEISLATAAAAVARWFDDQPCGVGEQRP
jgi:histidyl-tRNA synthetase